MKSYEQLIKEISSNGYIWNIGQISNSVIKQLDWAVSQEILIRKTEGYPLRGEGGIPTVMYVPGRRFEEFA